MLNPTIITATGHNYWTCPGDAPAGSTVSVVCWGGGGGGAAGKPGDNTKDQGWSGGSGAGGDCDFNPAGVDVVAGVDYDVVVGGGGVPGTGGGTYADGGDGSASYWGDGSAHSAAGGGGGKYKDNGGAGGAPAPSPPAGTSYHKGMVGNASVYGGSDNPGGLGADSGGNDGGLGGHAAIFGDNPEDGYYGQNGRVVVTYYPGVLPMSDITGAAAIGIGPPSLDSDGILGRVGDGAMGIGPVGLDGGGGLGRIGVLHETAPAAKESGAGAKDTPRFPPPSPPMEHPPIRLRARAVYPAGSAPRRGGWFGR